MYFYGRDISNIKKDIEELQLNVETIKPTFHITSEIRVWRAVILQALIDIATLSDSARYRRHKKRAQSWLLDPNDGFNMVCSLAGFDPLYVQNKAIKIINRNIKPIAKRISKQRKSSRCCMKQ
jgi:hypothetical protein